MYPKGKNRTKKNIKQLEIMTKEQKINEILEDLKDNVYESLDYLIALSKEALLKRTKKEIDEQYAENFVDWEE